MKERNMRVGGGIALWVLVISCLLFTSCQDDDPVVAPQYTTLKQALQDIQSISMIEADPDTAAVRKKATGRTDLLEQLAVNNDILVKRVVSINEENKDDAFRSYFVECAKQLGWQNNGYSYFEDQLAGTSFKLDDVLPYALHDEDRWVVSTYDGTIFNDIATNFFTNTTCPILLYYSYDDPWTAGKPRHVGPNVKMVINPIGKHSAIINDPALCPPETKKEVMDYVSRYIY